MTRNPMETRTEEDFLTIIAPSIAEAMNQFKARGLDREGYTIAGRVGRHALSYVDGAETIEMFGGEKMIAATFVRRRETALA